MVLFLCIVAALSVLMILMLNKHKEDLRDDLEEKTSLMFTRIDERLGDLTLRMEERDAKRINTLVEENGELRVQLKNALESKERAQTDLRRQVERMDREKKELEIQRKLLDHTLSLLGKGDESKGRAGNEDFEGESDLSGANEDPSKSAVLALINRHLDKYSKEGLKIAECERIEGSTIWKPILRMQTYLDAGSAVFLPEYAIFSASRNNVRIRCYGGILQKEGESGSALPNSGIQVARWTLESDEVLSPALSEVLGISPRFISKDRVEVDDRPVQEVILDKLNEILIKERGGKYKLTAIEKIEAPLLINVEFVKYDPGGAVANHVSAKTCEINLFEKDRYVEFLFKNGYFIADDQKRSFFNDQYRLPISNIEPDLWISARLDCITVK